ncbi:prephenate dehydrogenase [Methanobacterium petrolearium]|uniref:prephenate dehydrogenase n=1 Tax=Methanobacterium petrolearium TaxID=710190 RepID=UPI001AE8A7D3|nr:prephenate dehydrogenase [Methanobacterium petrolearium]MBP1946883.1 prephenate dehydrogenase [Methanobacterium petrolearium]BDZ70498.1 prephenate dehydrogenase [Methanobacterium petrolearium]
MQVAVIGGTRGLGNWMANFLKKKGCQVTITGRNSLMGETIANKMGASYTSNNVEAAINAEIVILAVPIEVTVKTIKEVAPHMQEGSLLVDVTSVKEKPAKIMYQHAPEGVEVLPTHPMFGPRIRSLDGQVVVLTPQEKGKWYSKVVNFLEKEQARVLVTKPEFHDRMMSIVQGLTHFAYISIASTIEKMQVDIKESRKFASPIYSLMLDMIARIVAQNPYLCYSIQTQNRYIPEVHETFLETFQDLKSMINQENQAEFVKSMSDAAKHLNDLEAALGRSDKAISALSAEVTTLKNSLGKEVGLRHMYSGKVHIGVLDSLSPDFLTLKENNKVTTLKISNIEILSYEQLQSWKMNNLPTKTFDVSVVLPERSQPEIISRTINSLEGMVASEVKDVYQGKQIPEGFKSITFSCQVISITLKKKVEELLVGFGGIIR